MTKKNGAPENANDNGKEETGTRKGLSKEAWAGIATIAAALITGAFLLLTHLIPPASPAPPQLTASSTPATPSANSGTTTAQSNRSSTPSSGPSESSTENRFPNSCLNQALSAIPIARKESAAIEGGEPDVVEGTDSKDGLAGVWLLANNQPIGAIIFSPIFADSQNYSFRVEHLLNSTCQETNYANVSDPEHKPVLHNWDQIKMNLGGHEYWFRLGYNTGSQAVTAKFRDKKIR